MFPPQRGFTFILLSLSRHEVNPLSFLNHSVVWCITVGIEELILGFFSFIPVILEFLLYFFFGEVSDYEFFRILRRHGEVILESNKIVKSTYGINFGFPS
jgi:hypothetical protein